MNSHSTKEVSEGYILFNGRLDSSSRHSSTAGLVKRRQGFSIEKEEQISDERAKKT